MKAIIKRLLYSALLRAGYQIIKNQDYVSPKNFCSIATSYEQLLNETVASDNPIAHNALRPHLMMRLQGTPPGEAYFIVMALAATHIINGDVCEFGVAQGETSALIANEIKGMNRILHLFDSFEGLPKPTDKDRLKNDIFSLGTMDAYTGMMSEPVDLVLARLQAIGFQHNNYVIHKGFFEKLVRTRTNFPTIVSFAYVDFDLYEPIKQALDFLDTVTPIGAVVIVDDYDFFSTGAKIAVDEFVAEKNIISERYSLYVPNVQYGHFAVLTKCS